MNALFNVPTAQTAPVSTSSVDKPAGVPVFTTPQSVLTFAGAPAMVSFLTRLAAKFWPAWGKAPWLVLALSLLVGAFIYWQSEVPEATPKAKIAAAFSALINSLMVAAAVMGVEAATS